MRRQFSFQHHIGKLDLAARFQDPENLAEQDLFAWREIDDAVRDHQIKEIIRERQLFRIHLFDFKIAGSGGGKILLGAADHFVGQVNAIAPAILTGQPAGHEQIETSPAADIKDGCSGRDFAEGKRIADPAKGCKEAGMGIVDGVRIICEGCGPFFAGRVSEFTGY